MNFPISVTLAAMISIQIGASCAKQLFPVVGAIGTTTLRLGIAALILLLVWRPFKVRLERSQKIALIAYGISLGLMNLAFYLAVERIPLGLAVSLEFCGPLILACYSSKRALDLVWVALATAGIILILPLTHTDNVDVLGVIFALLAGLAWTFYIVFGHSVASFLHEGRATALGMVVAFSVVIPIAIVTRADKTMSLAILPAALAIALLSSVIPYSLEMMALKRLSKQTFSILMSLEPAFAALAGFIFLKEMLTSPQWIAIACIISASLGTTFLGPKRQSIRII